jgi:hypothetical protein
MRNKRLKVSTLLMISLGLTGIQAQTMYVMEKSGTQTSYTLSDIQKMSFSSGKIMVCKTIGNTDAYALTDIRYLNFTNLSTGVSIVEKQDLLNKFQIFPNPVGDELNIKLAPLESQHANMEILSIDGKVVYKKVLQLSTEIHQVNVSALPKGMYLCSIKLGKSTGSIKFLKN